MTLHDICLAVSSETVACSLFIVWLIAIAQFIIGDAVGKNYNISPELIKLSTIVWFIIAVGVTITALNAESPANYNTCKYILTL